MEPLLKLRNVGYSYHTLKGETKALTGITFDVMEGEFVSIVGPSGCGKSTLLSIIAGLILPEEGSIKLTAGAMAQEALPDKSDKQLLPANASIGYMLQKDHLFEWRTVYENVLLGLEIQKKKTEENLRRVDEMLKTYGLYQFKNSRPSELSGGMRQRAALIRTLALDPELLLLDEPFSALDYQTRLSVCDDIATIIKNEKKTAILVTHDLAEAISVGKRIIVLSKRPATVKKEVKVVFKDKDGSRVTDYTPMQARNAPEFHEYFNLIWKELNENGA